MIPNLKFCQQYGDVLFLPYFACYGRKGLNGSREGEVVHRIILSIIHLVCFKINQRSHLTFSKITVNLLELCAFPLKLTC